MPKPDLTVKDERKIVKMTRAWSDSGTAINGFYSETERAAGNDYINNLATVMERNNYGTVREQMGSFLFMCMAGQVNEDGTPVYNMEDIYDPDKLKEEKIQLRQKIEGLLAPEANTTKENIKNHRELVDKYFSNGVKRACERLSEYGENSLKNNDITELMRPEASVLGFLLVASLTNAVQDSYETVNNERVMKANGLVSRLNDIGFDLEAYANQYEGMATYSSQLAQTMRSMQDIFNGRALSGLEGLGNYIGFANLMDKYRKNPNNSLSSIFSSLTRKQIVKRAESGQPVSLDDFSPNELGTELTYLSNTLENGVEIDEYGYSRAAMDDYIKANRDKDSVRKLQSYLEGFSDIMVNSTDSEYIYGIHVMYMNGRLYPNTSYSTDFKIVDKSKNPNKTEFEVEFENIGIKFDNVLDRKNVLKEAFLSDLDIEPYNYAPINEGDKEVSAINDERLSNVAELNNTIKGLKPVAGGSDEWKDMVYAVERAEKISEAYKQKYASFEDGAADVNEAERQAALEEVTSAMELARNAAHSYVVHKIDSGKYLEGNDYQRLKVAKKLENFSKQQCAYLNAKAAEKLNSIQEDKGYFNKESMEADIANIGKYSYELFKLGQTTFLSEEFQEMMHSIRQLQMQQKSIADGKQYNAENDTLYFGGPDESGVYRKGYIDRAIERIDDYIAHRRKEGITKDLYADRVDVASRLKRYLETIKAGAERTKEGRFGEHAYNKEADAHVDAFKKKYDEAKKVLIDIYTTIRDDVPADKLPAVKDAIYTMYAYQKYKNEADSIEAGTLTKSDASTVREVRDGKYNDLIKDFKEKQADADSFVNRHAKEMSSIRKILNDKTFSKTIPSIDRELADRKPLSEDNTFNSLYTLSICAVEDSKVTANELAEDRMDAALLSKFIVQKSMIAALEDISKLPTNDKSGRDKLAEICVNSTDDKIDSMAKKISRSEELKAIIDRYEGQKNLGDKLEAMYQDYAQLKVYTAKNDGDMPDNVDEFLKDARTKKADINKSEVKAQIKEKTEVKVQPKEQEKAAIQAPTGPV